MMKQVMGTLQPPDDGREGSGSGNSVPDPSSISSVSLTEIGISSYPVDYL
ncbi:MAG: hypothetical protein ACM37W_19185 [Actinomycetota bacterium]